MIGTNAPLRTDESFRNQENKQHHHSHSPLEELPIDMVKDIPSKYLHLILYGAMKRLLTLWIEGTKDFKFFNTDISKISEIHTRANGSKPSEINRPNRSLKCYSYWKATEFRTFLLKTGPVALQETLTKEMYNHFLALHCAVTICCSKPLNRWILTKNNEIFKINQMIDRDNEIDIHETMLLKKNRQNWYVLPIESMNLFIYKSKLQETVESITLNDMFCKLYRIEIDCEYSAFMPL